MIHQVLQNSLSVFPHSAARALGLAHAINTSSTRSGGGKARPELREADLSEEQVALIRNLAGRRPTRARPEFCVARACRASYGALKPAERLVIDLLIATTFRDRNPAGHWLGAALVKVRAFRARQS